MSARTTTLIPANLGLRGALFAIVLSATLIAFFYRGVEYAMLDSYGPLVLSVVVLGVLGGARSLGAVPFLWAVRGWSIALVLYGLVRMAIAIIANTPLLSHEAHVAGHLSVVFVTASAGYALAGVMLFRLARRQMPGMPA